MQQLILSDAERRCRMSMKFFAKSCCYLNIENEAVKNGQEKDRKQVKLTFTNLIFTANILILFTDSTASKKWSGLSDSRLSTNFF